MNDNIMTLYQILTDDIKNGKKLQWQVLYYSLLAFAALLALQTYLTGITNNIFITIWLWRVVILLLAIFIYWLSAYMLLDTQKWLCIYRMRIEVIREQKDLPPKLKEKFGYFKKIGGDKEDYYRFSRYLYSAPISFIILGAFGPIFITLLFFNDLFRCYQATIFCMVLITEISIFIWRFNKSSKETEDAKAELEVIKKELEKKGNT